MSVLEADGLVTPVRRKGTVVRARPPMRRPGVERYAKSKWKFGLVAFAADREASGRACKRDDQTNAVRRTEADADAAEALGVELGSVVYERAPPDQGRRCADTHAHHARMPTPDELELPAGEPVVVLHRTTYTAGNVPIEFARGIHAASRFSWTYSVKLPD